MLTSCLHFWVHGTDDPGRGVPDHPVAGDQVGKPGCERVADLIVESGGAASLEAEDLAGWAERHQEVDRLIDVLSHPDRLVAAVERDVGVARVGEDARGGI